MLTTLYIDYDMHDIVPTFKSAVFLMKHVFENKRTYMPILYVERCDRTKRGYHLTIRYEDAEIIGGRAMMFAELFLQGHFKSDACRGLMDYLRVNGGEKHHNLLFDYKGENKVKPDENMLYILNEILHRAGMR